MLSSFFTYVIEKNLGDYELCYADFPRPNICSLKCWKNNYGDKNEKSKECEYRAQNITHETMVWSKENVSGKQHSFGLMGQFLLLLLSCFFLFIHFPCLTITYMLCIVY